LLEELYEKHGREAIDAILNEIDFPAPVPAPHNLDKDGWCANHNSWQCFPKSECPSDEYHNSLIRTHDPRTLVWFSAGASSAVAAKMMLARGPAVIAYTDPGSEHPDNVRFLNDCEEWFGQKIVRLHSERYVDTWQVWEERRFLNGPRGALCTTELKRMVRFRFERPTDRQVFGYTMEETGRADRFREQNPGLELVTPLIDAGLSKADCLGIINRAGIELPAMYKLGYDHNNCVGCVKGGIGYWNKIRVDFPEVFDRMAALERTIGHSAIHRDGESVYLDELDPTRGSFATEPNIECSLLCELAEIEFSAPPVGTQE
jgi:hypothetical protein